MSYPSEAEIRRIYEEKRRKSRFPSKRRQSITQEQLEYAHDSESYRPPAPATSNQHVAVPGDFLTPPHSQPAPSGTIPGTTGNPSAPTAGGSSPVSSGSSSSGGSSRRNDKSKNAKQTATEDSSVEDTSLNDYESEMYGNGFPYWFAYGFDPISGGLYNSVSDSIAVSDERTVLDNFLGTFSEDISPGKIDTLTTLFDVFPLEKAESTVADSREVSVEEKTVIANYLGISAAQRAVAADIFGVSAAQRMTSAELLDINVGSEDLGNIVSDHLRSVILPIVDEPQAQTWEETLVRDALKRHIQMTLPQPATSLTRYLFDRPTSDYSAQPDELNARGSNQSTDVLEVANDAVRVLNTVVKNTDTEHIGNTAQHIGIIASHAANARGIRIPNFNSILSGFSAASRQLSNLGPALGMAGFVFDGTAGKSLRWTLDRVQDVVDYFGRAPTPLTYEKLERLGFPIYFRHVPGLMLNKEIQETINWYISEGDSYLEAAKISMRTPETAHLADLALKEAYDQYEAIFYNLPPGGGWNVRSRMEEVEELRALLRGGETE